MIYGSLSGSPSFKFSYRASAAMKRGPSLKVISAAIIGGAGLKGGAGTFAGAFIGAMLMSIIVSSITLLGIDPNWVYFVIGAALQLAVMAEVMSKRGQAGKM